MNWGFDRGGGGASAGGGASGGGESRGRGASARGGASPAGSEPDEPALLIRVYDPVEAEIILAKLRSAGIEAFAKHEALSVVYGFTVDGLAQQDIYVRSEDLEVARVALEPSS